MITRTKFLALMLVAATAGACNSDTKRVMDPAGSKSGVRTNGPSATPPPGSGDVTPGNQGPSYTAGNGNVYTVPELEAEQSRLESLLQEYYASRDVILNAMAEIIISEMPVSSAIEIEQREANRREYLNLNMSLLNLKVEIAEAQRWQAEINFFLTGSAYELAYWTQLSDELKAEAAATEVLIVFIDDDSLRATGEKTLDALRDRLAEIEAEDHVTQEEVDAKISEKESVLAEIEAIKANIDLLEESFASVLEELSNKGSLTAEEQSLKTKIEEYNVIISNLDTKNDELGALNEQISSKELEKSEKLAVIASFDYEINYRTNLISSVNNLIESKTELLDELFAKNPKSQEDEDKIAELDEEIINLEFMKQAQEEKLVLAEDKKLTAESELAPIEAELVDLNDDKDLLVAEIDIIETDKSTKQAEVVAALGNVEQDYQTELEAKEAELETIQTELEELTAGYSDYIELIDLYNFMIDIYLDHFGEE